MDDVLCCKTPLSDFSATGKLVKKACAIESLVRRKDGGEQATREIKIKAQILEETTPGGPLMSLAHIHEVYYRHHLSGSGHSFS